MACICVTYHYPLATHFVYWFLYFSSLTTYLLPLSTALPNLPEGEEQRAGPALQKLIPDSLLLFLALRLLFFVCWFLIFFLSPYTLHPIPFPKC